jgi:23S rRNA (uracil1939-C5)-methyltransferase
LPYDAQCRRKRERLAGALGRYRSLGALGEALEPLRGATPITGYRIRAKLVREGNRLGLYDRGGQHQVVDIPECRVLSAPLLEVVARLRALCATEGIPWLRAVDARACEDAKPALMVTLVVDARAPDEAVRAAVARLEAASPRLTTVAVSRHAGRSPRLLGARPEVVSGKGALRDRASAEGAFQYATPGAFVQAHRAQAAALSARVRELLDGVLGGLAGRDVLELYAGAGALGLELARAGARTTMIESFAPAARVAEEAAREQGLAVRAVAADAATACARLEGRFDAVVVDPPRRGLAPAVRVALGALEPRALVYVSCDPETLARDLDHLGRLGLGGRRGARARGRCAPRSCRTRARARAGGARRSARAPRDGREWRLPLRAQPCSRSALGGRARLRPRRLRRPRARRHAAERLRARRRRERALRPHALPA